MTITAGDGRVEGESAGSITSVKLVEVTVDPVSDLSTVVDNGACVEIQTASWDTMCTAGEKRCREDKVQTCSADRAWVTDEDCTLTSNVCSAESYTCVAPACNENDKRCTVDGKSEMCDADGNWQLSEDCAASDKVCNATTFVCEAASTCVESANSTYDTAIAITMGEYKESICATEGVDNGDWYSITLADGDELNMTVAGEMVFFDLYNADQSEMVERDYGGELNHTNSTGSEGVYYLKVYYGGPLEDLVDTDYNFTANIAVK